MNIDIRLAGTDFLFVRYYQIQVIIFKPNKKGLFHPVPRRKDLCEWIDMIDKHMIRN